VRLSRSIRWPVVLTALPLTLVFAALACSEDDPPDPTGSCGELASRCHPYDKRTAIGHECHELGHAGDDKACAPRRAECLAACPDLPDIDANTSHPTDDGGSSTDAPASSDAPAVDAGDICTPYCECLLPTCSSQTGFPFASVDACKTQCATLGTAEKVCWPKWCEKAKTLTNKTHTCEHAWGKLGLDECETLP
jgi:hypothetical protein